MTSQTQPVVSVLIPVYNWNLSRLARALQTEIESAQLDDQIEIVVADDCSTDAELRAANKALFGAAPAAGTRYLELDRNLGRAAVRNFLAAQSSGQFLLFLDSDVAPDNADFLRRYLEHARANAWDVVCGGISYAQRVLNDRGYDFYVYMSSRAALHPVAIRNRLPWRWIFTSNIMIRRRALEATVFDERFTGYGYEDIEWGIRLARAFRVLHIENPVSHLGLLDQRSLLEKMRASIPNYRLLAQLHPREFAQMRVALLVRALCWLPSIALRALDRAAARMFLALERMHPLALALLQFDKLVLLAMEFQRPTALPRVNQD
jgi:glycosyltransferase involved in cell wall biosynthesis